MTAESALLGVPTISYNASPNLVEKFLVKKNLIKRESDPAKIVKIVKSFLEKPSHKMKNNSTKLLQSMEDPHSKFFMILNA